MQPDEMHPNVLTELADIIGRTVILFEKLTVVGKSSVNGERQTSLPISREGIHRMLGQILQVHLSL